MYILERPDGRVDLTVVGRRPPCERCLLVVPGGWNHIPTQGCWTLLFGISCALSPSSPSSTQRHARAELSEQDTIVAMDKHTKPES